MTDITELAQSLQRRATSAKEFGESLYVKADDVLALIEALEKAQGWKPTGKLNAVGQQTTARSCRRASPS